MHSDVDVDVDAEADELLMSTFGEHIRDYSDIPMTFPRTHILPVVYQPETDIPKTSTQDEGISDIFMTQMSHNSAMENNSCNDNNADNSSNNNNNNNDESYQDSKSAYKISVGSNLSSPSNSRKASLIYPKSKTDEEKIISKIDSWNIPGPRSMAFPPRVPTITSAYAHSSGELSNAQHSSPPVCYVEAVDSGNRVDTLGCSIPILRDKSHLGEASTDIERTGLLSLVPARKDDHYPQSNIVGNEYSDNMMRIGHDVSPSPSSPPFTSPLLTPTTEALLCVMNASISQIKSNNNNIRNIDKHNGQNYNMNNNENAESRHQYENKETVNRCDTIFTNLTHPETPPTSDSISVSFSPFLTFTPDRDTTLPGISSRSDTGFPLGSTIQQNLEINRGRNRNRDVEKNEWWGE